MDIGRLVRVMQGALNQLMFNQLFRDIRDYASGRCFKLYQLLNSVSALRFI